MTLSSLIARIEGLSGPDREVDCLAWCAYHGYDFVSIAERGAGPCPHTYLLYRDPDGPLIDHLVDLSVSNRVPLYTASIDAAMTLVPEGMSFEVRRSGTGDRGQATVWDPMHAVGATEFRVTGCATPAIALVCAALRARDRISTGEGS